MQVGGRLLMPGSGVLELLLAAGSTLAPEARAAVTASAVSLTSPFSLDSSKAVTAEVKIDPAAGRAEVHSSMGPRQAQQHCKACLVQAAPLAGVGAWG